MMIKAIVNVIENKLYKICCHSDMVTMKCQHALETLKKFSYALCLKMKTKIGSVTNDRQ